jgi:hypothetical protein
MVRVYQINASYIDISSRTTVFASIFNMGDAEPKHGRRRTQTWETQNPNMGDAEPKDELSMASSDETTVEKSRRLVGGLIFEYGFADAMTDRVITDYSLGFVARDALRWRDRSRAKPRRLL